MGLRNLGQGINDCFMLSTRHKLLITSDTSATYNARHVCDLAVHQHTATCNACHYEAVLVLAYWPYMNPGLTRDYCKLARLL